MTEEQYKEYEAIERELFKATSFFEAASCAIGDASSSWEGGEILGQARRIYSAYLLDSAEKVPALKEIDLDGFARYIIKESDVKELLAAEESDRNNLALLDTCN